MQYNYGHGRPYATAIAKAKVMNNEMDIDLESLNRHVDEISIKQFEGQMRRYLGETLLNITPKYMNEAEEWIQ